MEEQHLTHKMFLLTKSQEKYEMLNLSNFVSWKNRATRYEKTEIIMYFVYKSSYRLGLFGLKTVCALCMIVDLMID